MVIFNHPRISRLSCMLSSKRTFLPSYLALYTMFFGSHECPSPRKPSMHAPPIPSDQVSPASVLSHTRYCPAPANHSCDNHVGKEELAGCLSFLQGGGGVGWGQGQSKSIRFKGRIFQRWFWL